MKQFTEGAKVGHFFTHNNIEMCNIKTVQKVFKNGKVKLDDNMGYTYAPRRQLDRTGVLLADSNKWDDEWIVLLDDASEAMILAGMDRFRRHMKWHVICNRVKAIDGALVGDDKRIAIENALVAADPPAAEAIKEMDAWLAERLDRPLRNG